MATEQVILYVRPGDPSCEAARRYLTERQVPHSIKDVTSDPSASAVLFGRLGKITVPAFQIGERLVVGFDPVQLARFLPRPESDEGHVAFGAAVRGVTAELARERGLPAPYGVEVGPVKEDSPAALAGIQPGDIITAIGSYTLTGGREQFAVAVGARHPGDTMTLTLWRDEAESGVVVEFPARAEVGSQAD